MSIEPESGEQLRKISIAPDLIGKAFFDENGGIWRLTPKSRDRLWGLFASEELELVKDSSNLVGSAIELTAESANKMLGDWQENTANSAIEELTKSLAPVINGCVSAGEKKFRKELLGALGTQGERMLSDFITDKFEAIGRVYEQEKKQERIFQTDGPFPLNTRFRWQLLTPKHTYTAFCLEAPPQCRTIHLFGAHRRLVFPWVRFLVYFVDGDLYETAPLGGNDHGHCGLGVFYGLKGLQSQADTLYLCNLPEVSSTLPFGTCLGSGRPPVKLSNPNWSQVLLEWFWGSIFYEGQGWSTQLWYQAANTIPAVQTGGEWEAFSSQKDCLTAVCALPWINSEYDLGKMVKTMLSYIAEENEESGKDPVQTRNGQLELLTAQFREQLEEKITFLGAHFSVPQDVVQNAGNFLSGKLLNLVERLSGALSSHCKKLGQNIGDQFREKINRKGGGNADLPGVDSRQNGA